MAISISGTPTRRGLTGPALVAGAFLLSTVAGLGFQFLGQAIHGGDPHRPEGLIESVESISVVGAAGLIVALAVALPLARDPNKARAGAIVLGALSVLSLVFFWSGAPAVLGAAAAWLAGLTKGARPLGGVARGFGIAGFVVAVLVVVATFAGCIAAMVSGS